MALILQLFILDKVKSAFDRKADIREVPPPQQNDHCLYYGTEQSKYLKRLGQTKGYQQIAPARRARQIIYGKERDDDSGSDSRIACKPVGHFRNKVKSRQTILLIFRVYSRIERM